MDWIFDNLQILFVIAAAIAYWLNNLRQAREAAREVEEPDVEEKRYDVEFDFGESMREQGASQPHTQVFLPPPIPQVRGIGGAAPPPLPGEAQPAARSMRREFPAGTPTPPRPIRPVHPSSPLQAEAAKSTASAELERQRNLEQRISDLRANREKRKGGASATKQNVAADRAARRGHPVGENAAPPIALDGIRERLRSTREARRAIVMREILDTPVGMR